MSRSKSLSRLLRLGIRASIALDENRVLLSRGNHIFELDLLSGERSGGYFIGDGLCPLAFTRVEGIRGFDDAVVFGGYLMNMDKEPVHIYKRKSVDQWEVVYTFLLSCRILGKGIESAFLSVVLNRLRERGVREVRALYSPTSKNG